MIILNEYWYRYYICIRISHKSLHHLFYHFLSYCYYVSLLQFSYLSFLYRIFKSYQPQSIILGNLVIILSLFFKKTNLTLMLLVTKLRSQYNFNDLVVCKCYSICLWKHLVVLTFLKSQWWLFRVNALHTNSWLHPLISYQCL